MAFHLRSHVIQEENAVPSVAVQPAVGEARALPAPQALAAVRCTLRLLQRLRPRRTPPPAADRTKHRFEKRNRLFLEMAGPVFFLWNESVCVQEKIIPA